MGVSYYYHEKRRFVIRFSFIMRSDAINFRLPDEYKEKFELTDNVMEEGNDFLRVAQIKLKMK